MTKKDVLTLLLILLPNLFLRAYRLDYTGGAIFDEKAYYLDASRSYLEGRDDPNIEHPPLGKELVAFGIRLFGDNPYGWRIPSLFFSLIGIALTYFLAKEMMGGYLAPVLSSVLLSLDNMYFIHSRLAVLEMFLVTFILGMALFLWRYFQKSKLTDLALLSIFFGLGISTKWTAVLALPLIVVFLYFRKKSFPRLVLELAIITFTAGLIYILSYLPYIEKHSFWGFLVHQQTIVGFWLNFGNKTEYNWLGYILTHAFVWLFNPSWDYDLRIIDESKVGFVRSMFNPVIFWFSIYLTVRSFKDYLKAKDRRLFFLLLPILLNFFPWLLVKRVQYLYYLLFSLPFMCLLISYYLSKKYRENQDGKYQTVWFVATAALVFIYFYPLLTSVPVSKRYLSPLTVGPIIVEDKGGNTLATVR